MPAPSRSDWAVDRSPGTHAIIRRSVLLLLLVLWTGTGRTVDAQPSVQLDTHVSADSVLIGGRFTVSFVAEHDGAVTVSFPSPGEGLGQLGDVEVRRRRVVDRQSVRGGRQVDSAAYEVTTFALDSARVPPVPLQIVAGDNLQRHRRYTRRIERECGDLIGRAVDLSSPSHGLTVNNPSAAHLYIPELTQPFPRTRERHRHRPVVLRNKRHCKSSPDEHAVGRHMRVELYGGLCVDGAPSARPQDKQK